MSLALRDEITTQHEKTGGVVSVAFNKLPRVVNSFGGNAAEAWGFLCMNGAYGNIGWIEKLKSSRFACTPVRTVDVVTNEDF